MYRLSLSAIADNLKWPGRIISTILYQHRGDWRKWQITAL